MAMKLRPFAMELRFRCILYPFYIDSEILIRLYYDMGASTALLMRSCRFCYDSCHFDQNFESERNRRPVEWGRGNQCGIYLLIIDNGIINLLMFVSATLSPTIYTSIQYIDRVARNPILGGGGGGGEQQRSTPACASVWPVHMLFDYC